MQGLYKDKYRIKSTRLKDFDYSSNGAYFVTMCTKNREFYFGHAINGKIKLSDMGKIVEKCWYEIPQHFENVILDEFVVMPNHVHGIIIIDNNRNRIHDCRDGVTPSLQRPTLGQIIGYFKYRATKLVNQFQNTPGVPIWQPRFYEHVIRNDHELNRIREYIINNPLKWQLDKNNPKNYKI